MDNKHIARSTGVGIDVTAKGAPYLEDTLVDDEIILTARKLTRAVRIAEEDIADLAGFINTLEVKKLDWAGTYAKYLDNAVLGVSIAATGATAAPWTSIYRAVTTADATTGYSANANLVQTAGTGADFTYDKISQAFGLLETSDYWDEGSLVCIAHPSVKASLRSIKDTAGIPIFGTSATGQNTIFDVPVKWSLGARKVAAATPTPSGNPLIVIGNKDYMFLGKRSGPESVVIDGRDGASALTDETILKLRARRAFGLGYPQAVAVLERIP
jgi:HK97 family phage major capsid protein